MSTPNVPLMREVAGWIRTQLEYAPSPFDRAEAARGNPTLAPDLIWDQDIWMDEVYGAECKTSCCVAGYVALTDPEVDVEKTRLFGHVYFKDETRDPEYFDRHARARLGLEFLPADRLFYTSNDPDRVLELLSEAAGEEL